MIYSCNSLSSSSTMVLLQNDIYHIWICWLTPKPITIHIDEEIDNLREIDDLLSQSTPSRVASAPTPATPAAASPAIFHPVPDSANTPSTFTRTSLLLSPTTSEEPAPSIAPSTTSSLAN